MRRRVLIATISALGVAVVLLGIPLGIAAAQLVRGDALRSLDARTATAARALEVRFLAKEAITSDILGAYISGVRGSPSYIYVRMPDGSEYHAGVEPSPAYSESHVTTRESSS